MIIDKLGYYRTRDGRKVWVVCVDAFGEYPVIGQFFERGGVITWDKTGRHFIGKESKEDIVSLWTEKPIVQWDALPKWADRWFTVDVDGTGYCYSDKPIIDENEQIWYLKTLGNRNEIIEFVGVPEKFFSYTGNWRESLVENPKYAEEK